MPPCACYLVLTGSCSHGQIRTGDLLLRGGAPLACCPRRPEVRSEWLPILPIKGFKMNDLTAVEKTDEWRRMKSLVLDSVSSPITKRVYNMALDEFFGWYAQEPRPGFTKATVSAWRVTLEERGLGSSSIIVRKFRLRGRPLEQRRTSGGKARNFRVRISWRWRWERHV